MIIRTRNALFGLRSGLLSLAVLAVPLAAQGQVDVYEDFSSGILPATLERASGTDTPVFNGSTMKIPTVSGSGAFRTYYRTKTRNYFSVCFVAEVTVTINSVGAFGAGTVVFGGLGLGEGLLHSGKSNRPVFGPNIHVFANPTNFFPQFVIDDVDASLVEAVIATPVPTFGGDGTHRYRLEWNADTMEAAGSIDNNYDGVEFVADYVSPPIDGSDNGFTAANSHIFFGGGDGIIFDDLSVTVLPCGQPPTADAGVNQAIRAGDTVNLSGSGFDDNTDPGDLAYLWSFSSVPGGSTSVLVDFSTATPSFNADLVGTYVVDLVVTDTSGLSSSADSVEVSTLNLAPTSAATADTALAFLGQTVGFDGSGSSDPESDTLSYAWITTMQPVGSTATLTGANTDIPTLVPDLEGDYEVTLTVSDFLGAGTSASAGFTATTASGYAELQILDACALTEGLAANQVKSKGNQKAFCNHLRNAIKDLQKGKTGHAIETLEKAIERTDGCPERGLLDGNGSGMDWITDCDAQNVVYGYLTSSIAALTL
jgi:hypothetical protein